ncbi:hypothetical protein PZA11_001991 [Diplocarpon coronariae]|nr:hypothetical protein JHW43_001747 [Diplocarpon mali]
MCARPLLRASRRCIQARTYATGTSTTPPMLLKIRKDMKTAMQQKDTNRLSVLRSLLSQSLNASKTSSPINTDMQVLALLRRSVSAGKAASAEFSAAGRQDLADKEELQIKVLEEYAGGVEVLGEEEVRRAVQDVLEEFRGVEKEIKVGDVLKRVFAPEVLGDKPVEKGDVARIVKELLN